MKFNTILQQAWKLTNDIKNTYKYREKYKKLVNSINRDKPTLAYSLNNKALQFAGFLIINHQRDKINKDSVVKIPDEFSPKEIAEIVEIFCDFHQINLFCLEPILQFNPKLQLPLLHYLEFDFDLPDINKTRKISLLSKNKLLEFKKIFATHPSFKILLSPNKLHSLNTISLVKETNKYLQLLESGKLVNTKIFQDFTYLSSETQVKKNLNFLFAIICLRKSIQILNELLFMQIIYDKLPIIDKSNRLTTPNWHSDLIRNGFSTQCIINDKSVGLLHHNWIFFMEEKESKYTPLHFCNERQISISDEFGEQITLHADNIDKNLNPYSNLLD